MINDFISVFCSGISVGLSISLVINLYTDYKLQKDLNKIIS